MEEFSSFDGTRIAYETWGTDARAPWVVLHHGFIVNHKINWVRPGFVDALRDAGRRVVALDARGHGRSEKPHDPARYGEKVMARDLGVLFDLLEEPVYDLVGYSMGAVTCLIHASRDRRVRRLAIGGVGEGVIACGGLDARALPPALVAAGMRADDASTIENLGARGMRMLADAVKADRLALGAAAQSANASPIALDAILAPTLVFAGDADPLAVQPEALAAAIPNSDLLVVPGDHLTSLNEPKLRARLVAFLEGGA